MNLAKNNAIPSLISTNPACGYQKLGEVACSTPEEITGIVALAQAAKASWALHGLSARLDILKNFYALLTAEKDTLAQLSSQEMGMPIMQSKSEVSFGLDYFRWNLDQAEHLLSPLVTFENAREVHKVFYRPYGVVGLIIPWNYPFTNFIWGAIQNLIVGNTVVFKHSEETSLFGKALERVIHKSGFPEGVLQEIYGNGTQGQQLAESALDLLCFTGSSAVGHQLYAQAAKDFRPVIMELGGSDPGIVLEDAPLADTIKAIWGARFSNCGQCCSGLKRLLVHTSRYEEILGALSHCLDKIVVGDPLHARTQMGPLVAARQKQIALSQYEDAILKGAKIAYQKNLPLELEGAYVSPTLFTNVTSKMRIWHEEVFAPFLPIVPFTTMEEAVSLANDTRYGLGAYIFSQSTARVEELSQRLNVGMVQMNDTEYTRPPNPFGGNKLSGLGRENGSFGFHHLSQTQLISFIK